VHLSRFECELIDLGCDGTGNCDYPDYAAPAARMVAGGEADAAVLLDGSGIGMGIVANKIRGIRAATAHDEITARIAREHNHCNVLCVGTDLVSEKALARIVEIFLTTPFSEGRHIRRVAKIAEIEELESMPSSLKMSSSA
jgi:ribose 5-phosphate isomerase B